MTRPRIGLALGSGSARGWAHIGVIDALTEAGIAPDVVCGASMGALVGAAFVAGRMAELRQWAEGATWRKIARLTDVRLSGGGLISGRQVVALLQALGIGEPIERYAVHYAAVATDMATGREIWLQSGPIHEAVRASIALPGILSPARLDGKWLLDGGLSNPIPVSVCRALGADIIIAVNLNGELLGRRFTEPEPPAEPRPSRLPIEVARRMFSQWPQALPETLRAPLRAAFRRPPVDGGGDTVADTGTDPGTEAEPALREAAAAPGYFDVLATAINIMQDHITRTRLAGEPPHVLLVPRLRKIGLLEFNRADEAIAEGRACVEQALPTLRRYL